MIIAVSIRVSSKPCSLPRSEENLPVPRELISVFMTGGHARQWELKGYHEW